MGTRRTRPNNSSPQASKRPRTRSRSSSGAATKSEAVTNIVGDVDMEDAAGVDVNVALDSQTGKAKVGKPCPLFVAPSVTDDSIGIFDLSNMKGRWVILLFYPKDFTYVCPTELLAYSDRLDDFIRANATVCAISTDSEFAHRAWLHQPRHMGGILGCRVPLLSDCKHDISRAYNVLDEGSGVALRGLYLINPDGVVEHMTVNNLPVGRNADESLRLLRAFQYVRDNPGVMCPVNWEPESAGL